MALAITIGAGDARRLMVLAVAAGLTAEACAASIVAEVLADDATCHQGERDGEGWDQARWDRAAKAAARSASSGAFDGHGGEGQLQ